MVVSAWRNLKEPDEKPVISMTGKILGWNKPVKEETMIENPEGKVIKLDISVFRVVNEEVYDRALRNKILATDLDLPVFQ